ncbi:uncharacterized protein V1516DRAFT_678043 [Lipomyces oligophaga]|uniref:uncharacterized protein n=1 Tax=Lipomyces oligophaga TaxID=45792 RepID=UPI0034CD1683
MRFSNSLPLFAFLAVFTAGLPVLRNALAVVSASALPPVGREAAKSNALEAQRGEFKQNKGNCLSSSHNFLTACSSSPKCRVGHEDGTEEESGGQEAQEVASLDEHELLTVARPNPFPPLPPLTPPVVLPPPGFPPGYPPLSVLSPLQAAVSVSSKLFHWPTKRKIQSHKLPSENTQNPEDFLSPSAAAIMTENNERNLLGYPPTL